MVKYRFPNLRALLGVVVFSIGAVISGTEENYTPQNIESAPQETTNITNDATSIAQEIVPQNVDHLEQRILNTVRIFGKQREKNNKKFYKGHMIWIETEPIPSDDVIYIETIISAPSNEELDHPELWLTELEKKTLVGEIIMKFNEQSKKTEANSVFLSPRIKCQRKRGYGIANTIITCSMLVPTKTFESNSDQTQELTN